LASILLGRALGPDGYGTFAVALSFQAFLIGLASIGLRNGIAYEVATGRWSADSALRQAIVASILLGGLGAAVGTAVYVAAGDSVLPGISGVTIAWLLVGIPMGVSILLLVGIATAMERYEAAAVLQAGPPVGIAVLASALAIPFGLNPAVAAIGGASIFVGLLAAAWALRLASRMNSNPRGGATTHHLKQATRFGLRIWASDLLSLMSVRGDLILVSAFATSQETGLYAVAATLTTLGLIVPEALAQVLLPRVASLGVASSGPGPDATVARSGRHATLIALATSVALVLAILLVPVIYGHSFQGAIKLGLILVPGTAALGVSRVLSYALAGLGEPERVLRLSALVVVPTIAAFILVIPAAGASGAAVVSTCSYILTLLVMVVALSRRTGIPPAGLILPRRDDLSAYRHMAKEVLTYIRSHRKTTTPGTSS
jgi:O-antigen/teichoic acid export membrane protein